jgi:hypothetical protein
MMMINIATLAMLEKTRRVNTGMMRLFIPARKPEIPQFKQAISAKLTASIARLFRYYQQRMKKASSSNRPRISFSVLSNTLY